MRAWVGNDIQALAVDNSKGIYRLISHNDVEVALTKQSIESATGY